jgi:hypothetical protein
VNVPADLLDLEPVPESGPAAAVLPDDLVPVADALPGPEDLEMLPDDERMFSLREATFNDPGYVMTPQEFEVFVRERDKRQTEVDRFLGAVPAAVGGLAQVAAGAVKERAQSLPKMVTDPVGFAAQEVATGAEGIRKMGVGLAQLWTWAGNKVGEVESAAKRQAYVRSRLAQEGKLTGDLRGDQAAVQAAMAQMAETDPAFAEFDREDLARGYEQYTRTKALDRALTGATGYRLGTAQMTEGPQENPYVVADPRTGEVVKPQENLSTVVSMAADPVNLIPMGAGSLSKLRVLRRFANATGAPLGMVERAAARLEDFGERAVAATSARLTDATGLTLGQQTALGSGAVVAGTWASQNGAPGVGAGVALIGGVLPALRASGAVLRRVGATAGAARQVAVEVGAGATGAARAAAAQELAAAGTIPARYAQHLAPGGASGVDSTLKRVALSTENPEGLRRVARLADRMGVTRAARAADDVVSGAVAGAAVAAPMAALLAPDAESAGSMIGTAGAFGAAGGVVGGVAGRNAQRVDADIARMLADVHAAGGDVSALMVMPHGELAKLAGMQGLLQDKVDFVPLRRRDYRANADVTKHAGETAEGMFVEKGGTDRARIFVDLGEPAPFDGTVRIEETPEGRMVSIRADDGRTDSTLVPKSDKLLVRDGQRVSANAPLVQGWNRQRVTAHEIGHAIFRSDMLDGNHRADIRNMINQLYGEEGVQARAREYAARLVDADIRAGAVEDAPMALSPEEQADVDAGRKTAADVLKSRAISPQQRARMIEARMEQLNDEGAERGDFPMDWARDEIAAETWADAAQGLDFASLRRGGTGEAWSPRLAESVLNATSRILEVLGVKFDPSTGKMQGTPGELFTQNPLLQDAALKRRVIEYTRNYDAMLAGLEDAGRAEAKGVALARSARPEDLARSQHVKLRDYGRGILENDFMFIGPDGRPMLKTQAEINAADKARAKQIEGMIPGKVLPQNATTFGRRRTSDGKLVVGGPVLPAIFDHFTQWPQHVRNFARALENGRNEGVSWFVDYNAIGTGSSGSYKVTNLGNVRAIQREVVPFGWMVSRANHLLVHALDVNAFRAAAMKAINAGELGLFNNDMRQVQADLLTYMENHRSGMPGEARIGTSKRDMLNGLLSTGTATARAANPNFYELNPRGVIRAFRLDRVNDLQQSGRKGMWFDYDKVNNNRMPRRVDERAGAAAGDMVGYGGVNQLPSSPQVANFVLGAPIEEDGVMRWEVGGEAQIEYNTQTAQWRSSFKDEDSFAQESFERALEVAMDDARSAWKAGADEREWSAMRDTLTNARYDAAAIINTPQSLRTVSSLEITRTQGSAKSGSTYLGIRLSLTPEGARIARAKSKEIDRMPGSHMAEDDELFVSARISDHNVPESARTSDVLMQFVDEDLPWSQAPNELLASIEQWSGLVLPRFKQQAPVVANERLETVVSRLAAARSKRWNHTPLPKPVKPQTQSAERVSQVSLAEELRRRLYEQEEAFRRGVRSGNGKPFGNDEQRQKARALIEKTRRQLAAAEGA